MGKYAAGWQRLSSTASGGASGSTNFQCHLLGVCVCCAHDQILARKTKAKERKSWKLSDGRGNKEKRAGWRRSRRNGMRGNEANPMCAMSPSAPPSQPTSPSFFSPPSSSSSSTATARPRSRERFNIGAIQAPSSARVDVGEALKTTTTTTTGERTHDVSLAGGAAAAAEALAPL